MTRQPRAPRPSLSFGSRLLTGCAVTALLCAAPALAQDARQAVTLPTIFLEASGARSADDSTIVADHVTSGSGLPIDILDSSASISVVTSREIEDRGADTTEEVLQYTSGVNTDFYGTDDRFDYFRIRGFDAFTYRDGLLIGENFGGVREEPYAFDRVEVLKGANSTAFGVADPGGAVNFITKVPTGERQREVQGTLGSFERKELAFDLGDSFAPGSPFSWRLTGKVAQAETEVDFSNDDETFLLGGLAWRPTEATTVVLTFDNLFRDGFPATPGYPDNGEKFDRSLFLGDPDFNYLDTDRDTITLKLVHDVSDALEFGSTVRFTDGTGGFGYTFIGGLTSPTTVSRSYFANSADYHNIVGDAHLLYRGSIGSVVSRTLGGVEFRDNHRKNDLYFTAASEIDFTNPQYTGGFTVDGTTPFTSTQNDERVRSLYLQQELDFGPIVAQVGLRNDDIDLQQLDRLTGITTRGDFNETTGRLGLTYRATPDFSIFGSYAQSVVPAGFGVEPEEGKQYELGVKYRLQGGQGLFTASIFDLSKTNETITDPATLLPSTIGESRARGIDMDLKAEFTERLSMIAAYSYVSTDIVASDNGENDGNALQQTPRHLGSLWLNYQIPGQGAFGDTDLGLGARYTGKYYTAADNAFEIEDAIVLDAAVGYALSETTEMRLNVSNLLDEQHVAQTGFTANYYNPGREVALTLRHRW